MMAKVTGGDGSISEKKRIRIKALEQRLSVAASSGLKMRLRSQSQQDEKHKKKKGTKKNQCSNSSSLTRMLLQDSLTSSKPSDLQDAEAKDPTYFKLHAFVHGNLSGNHLQNPEKGGDDTIDGILHDILKSGGVTKDMKGELEKMQDKYLLLDNPTIKMQRVKARARIRALRKRIKRSHKHMSMRQHRQFGSFDFPKKHQKYDLYLPMYEMWKEYIVELLEIQGRKNIGYYFLTADLHGSILAVVESKVKSFVGVQGIMIRETANTFGILTSENRFRAGCWQVKMQVDINASMSGAKERICIHVPSRIPASDYSW